MSKLMSKFLAIAALLLVQCACGPVKKCLNDKPRLVPPGAELSYRCNDSTRYRYKMVFLKSPEEGFVYYQCVCNGLIELEDMQ